MKKSYLNVATLFLGIFLRPTLMVFGLFGGISYAVADTPNLTYEVTIAEVNKGAVNAVEQYHLIAATGKPTAYTLKKTHSFIEKCTFSRSTGEIDNQMGEKTTGIAILISPASPDLSSSNGSMVEVNLDYSNLLRIEHSEVNHCTVDLPIIHAFTAKQVIVVEKGKKIDLDQFKDLNQFTIGNKSYVASIKLLN